MMVAYWVFTFACCFAVVSVNSARPAYARNWRRRQRRREKQRQKTSGVQKAKVRAVSSTKPVPRKKSTTTSHSSNNVFEHTRKFQITLVNMGKEKRMDNAVRKAARRWENVIHGDLPDVMASSSPNFDWFSGYFGHKRYNTKKVDDVLVGYEFIKMDGRGGKLGSAVARRVRGSPKVPPFSTISGGMRLDIDDLFALSELDRVNILTHELGHILGLGSVSKMICASNCEPATHHAPTRHARYDASKCPNAGKQAVKLGLLSSRQQLSMETRGGRGSSCLHIKDLAPQGVNWSSVMSAIFDGSKKQLITRIDLGALMDLGGYKGIALENADASKGPHRNLRQVNGSMTLDLGTNRSSFVLKHASNADQGSAGMHNAISIEYF